MSSLASPIAPASATRRPSGRLGAGIFLAVFFVTLLLGGNTPPYNDGKQIFAHAENIVYQQELGTVVPGARVLSPRPLLVSLIHVPSVALRRALGHFFPAADAQTRVLTSHIVPAALLAATAVLFVRFLLQLGVSAGMAGMGSVLLAFSTMLFVFGRVVWSDIVQALAFWGFFSGLLAAVREPTRRRALLLGLWAGLLVNTKYLFVLSVGGGMLFALAQMRGRLGPRQQAVLAGWAVLAALPFAVPIAWFNYLRSGTIFHAGYGIEPFQESILWGLYSLFFSFGKGFFIYNPLLAFCWKPSPKLPPRYWWAVLVTCGPVVLLYSKYSNWGGDWSWGPRYLIFLVPVLMVPVALLLESLWQARRKLALSALAGVAAVGLFIQLLGAGVYWDHFIRLSQAATTQWLGNPNRTGGYTPMRGAHCDPCFEDLRGHTYLPAFQPIEGHYWLLKHAVKGDTWEQAVADAPWRRYTSLPLDVTRRWYPWPSVDWWCLSWTGKLATAGKAIFVFLLLGAGLGVMLWLSALRRWPRPAPPSPPAGAAASHPSDPSVDPATSDRADRAAT